MFVRPDVQAYLDAVAANDGPSIVDLDPLVARAIGRQSAPMIERPARDMTRRDIRIPTRCADIPARLYYPIDRSDAAPLIVYYHGGGWVLGDVDGYDPLCSEIAFLTGMTLLSVDYRLAPEHPFPAAAEDAIDAAIWAATCPDVLDHPLSGLILAGDSAGGTLAIVAARALIGRAAAPMLAQLLIYPVTDITRLYPSDIELSPMLGVSNEGRETFYRHYLGAADTEARKRDPQVSPLLGEDWQGLPPTVLLTCSLDPLRDQGRALAVKLVKNGIATTFLEAEGQVHASFNMRRMIPSAQDDLARVLAALSFVVAGAPRPLTP